MASKVLTPGAIGRTCAGLMPGFDVPSDALPFTAQVISVRRYFSHFSASTVVVDAPLPTNEGDLFDVVLSDGEFKATFVLSPAISALASQHVLRDHCLVRVQRVYCRFDDSLPVSRPRLVLQSVEILPDIPKTILQAKRAGLKWSSPVEPADEWVPSVGGRKSYLEMFTDTFLLDDPSWAENRDLIRASEEETKDALARRISIEQLGKDFKQAGDAVTVIVGRVVRKSQVLFFPGTGTQTGYPFHAYITVSDGTGTVAAVLWYTCCRDHFSSLHVGDIISLSGFRARPITMHSSPYAPEARLELGLNSQKPEAKIKLLPAEEAQAAIKTLADVMLFDCPFFSIATAGRVEVDRFKQSLFAYRWILLRDDSSSKPMLLKLFAGYQCKEHGDIIAGDLLLCARVRVCATIATSRTPLVHYLQTTRTSHFATARVSPLAFADTPGMDATAWSESGQDSKPIEDDGDAGEAPRTRLSALLAWALHADETLEYLQKGLVLFPPPAHVLAPPVQPVTGFSSLPVVIAGLRHRERRQIVIKGFLSALALVGPDGPESIEWHPLATLQSAQPAKRRRGRAKGKSTAPTFGVGSGVLLAGSHAATLKTGFGEMSPLLVSEGREEKEFAPLLTSVWMLVLRDLNNDGSIQVLVPPGPTPADSEELPPMLRGRSLGSDALDDSSLLEQVVSRATEWNGVQMVAVVDLYRTGAAVEIALNRVAKAVALA